MTRPLDQVLQAEALIDAGVSTWVRNEFAFKQRPDREKPPCDPCPHIELETANPAYAYLLGLCLGDGCISWHPRGVYRLRITLDLKYPGIIEECRGAILCVHAGRVAETLKIGCLEVSSYWKHWPCLFPQHGAGPKHKRPIVLEGWQRQVAVVQYPHLLLRGLIHSDGCKIVNNVKVRGKAYAYSRYHFSNRSVDIHAIFTEACTQVGVATRFNNQWNQSIARRPDIKRMDLFVGSKF